MHEQSEHEGLTLQEPPACSSGPPDSHGDRSIDWWDVPSRDHLWWLILHFTKGQTIFSLAPDHLPASLIISHFDNTMYAWLRPFPGKAAIVERYCGKGWAPAMDCSSWSQLKIKAANLHAWTVPRRGGFRAGALSHCWVEFSSFAKQTNCKSKLYRNLSTTS